MSEPTVMQDAIQTPNTTYRAFLLALLFFSLYLAYMMLRPFLHTLIFAVALASLSYPIYTRMVQWYRGRKNLAAFSVVFIITFMVVLPILMFAASLVTQGVKSLEDVNEWLKAGNLEQLQQHPRVLAATEWLKQHTEITRFIDLHMPDLQAQLLNLSKNFGQFIFSRGASLVGNAAGTIANFCIMMFIIFYLVRDGSEMISKIKYLSPLRNDQEDRIIGRIRAVARSALLGNFLTAVCQGVVGGIGLSIAGIAGLFWGTMMGFSSLIPVVGTALVWVPAVGYLLLVGQQKWAVFLIVWNLVFGTVIDNVLRPYLMRGEGGMSTFYLFLAIIGGVQYFGLVGIFYGPLVLAFAMVMLYIYGIEYRDLLTQNAGADSDLPGPGDAGSESSSPDEAGPDYSGPGDTGPDHSDPSEAGPDRSADLTPSADKAGSATERPPSSD